MTFKPLALAFCLLAGVAVAQPKASSSAQPGFLTHDSDVVQPNSPWKAQGMPDAGQFNPASGADEGRMAAPAAVPYRRPAATHSEQRRARPPKGYALVAAPTLPCAPAYCPRRAARADRN